MAQRTYMNKVILHICKIGEGAMLRKQRMPIKSKCLSQPQIISKKGTCVVSLLTYSYQQQEKTSGSIHIKNWRNYPLDLSIFRHVSPKK